MNRLLVALLAAFDAVVAVAVGIAAALAPLTLLWVFGLGATADWGALWPAAVRVWQVGHLVPAHVELSDEYLVATGIPTDAASFAFSLAPLAFAVFTAAFAARSGARAAHAGAWLIGLSSGTVVFAALSAAAAVTAGADAVWVTLWQAVLLPTLVFFVPALIGSLVGAWREGDGGLVDLLSDRVHADERWRPVPAAIARGTGAALTAVVGVGAALLAIALAVRGGEIVALFETAHVDLVGAIVVALAQLAYLPTLVIWSAAYAAGPGFALGAGSTVSPAGTDLGVVPGIPVLGVIPEHPSGWLLLLVLLIIGAGLLAGWIARARLAAQSSHGDDIVPRAVTLLGIVVLTGAGAALLAAVAAGAMGPERLQVVGTQAGPVSLAIAIEVAVGAAIMLLAPHSTGASSAEPRTRGAFGDAAPSGDDGADGDDGNAGETALTYVPAGEPAREGDAGVGADQDQTQPIEPLPVDGAPLDPDQTQPIEPLGSDTDRA